MSPQRSFQLFHFWANLIWWNGPFKGTVRRDARWVENGLKRCVLTNYTTASLLFFFLKRHHHEKSIKPVSASLQQLNWICRLHWQNPANDGLHTFNSIDFSKSHELQATSLKQQAASFELQATSYELQVMSYEIRNMSYELRDTSYKIAPAPADECTVQPCTVVWLYCAGLYRTLIEFSWLLCICTGWWMYGTSAVPYIHQPA
jgi:hypothetical protein